MNERITLTPILPKHGKKSIRSFDPKGGVANRDISLSEFNAIKSQSPLATESTPNTSIHSKPIDQNMLHNSHQSLTSMTSPLPTSPYVTNSSQRKVPNVVSDGDADDENEIGSDHDDEDEHDNRLVSDHYDEHEHENQLGSDHDDGHEHESQLVSDHDDSRDQGNQLGSDHDDEQEYENQILSDQRSVLSVRPTNSTATGDNDIIEIHQFSLVDIDEYLNIYFETLDNRLRHFIGEDEQLQQFRIIVKNRISSDRNAREHRNVLLGKLRGEVVAAVILLFSDETPTISNHDILLEENSCLTSIRRWMRRKANYVPDHTEECYIEMIGVKSAYRNRGIGAALLECIEHFARQAGARMLTIHVNREQLRTYFQRFGFVLDHKDKSTFWKGMVERESITKMSKTISPEGNSRVNNGYVNDSMVEDPDQ